jgi:hypothetical protein
MGLVWGIVLVRGLFTALDPVPYLPRARYGYPVIVPVALLLMGGWSYWRWPEAVRRWRPTLFWVSFLVLNFASVATVIRYYLSR